MSPARLSKSRVIAWRQCPRRLWLEAYRPDLKVVPAALQRSFDLGHQVGEVARALHPGGHLIDPPTLGEAARETARLLARPGDLTLFEATFSHGGVLVRADLLFREGGVCRMVEVKSSTEPKPYHIEDIAVQTWVVRGAGVPLERVVLAVVDRDFVYQGDGDYHGLFREVDVTSQVDQLVAQVPSWIGECGVVLAGDEPGLPVSAACTTPFSCPFFGYCSAGRPEFPVELLPRGGRVAEQLVAAGYDDLRLVPEHWSFSDTHRRVWRVTRTGEPDFDAAAAAHLAELPWPRFYLDFETVQFAVPVWAGTRPWEQLPFQWSCHVETAPGRLEHREFLDLSGEPPMRECAERLLEALAQSGPVLVYTGFEKGVLAGLATRFPDLDCALQAVADRLVDLHPVTERAWYHPAMKGSWSIKAVLPTVAPELDYADLGEVSDGSAAQNAYAEAVHPYTSPERADELAAALSAYCAQDTLALVRLAHFLQGS